MIKARFLIGADGADSQVRRLVGQFDSRYSGLALEADAAVTMQGQEISFDFGVVSHGYGWVFPKRDHVNVGLYTWSPSVRLTPELLCEYAARRLGVDLGPTRGHRLGIGGWEYRPTSRRVFLIGDAAGMVEPLLGEGISNAILSGQAAAAAIVEELTGGRPALDGFRHRLRPIRRDLASGYRSARLYYHLSAQGYALLTSRYVRDVLMRGYALGVPFRTIKRFGWWLLMKQVPRLPDLG
jgi:flavin-dependent dehydrogenase